MKPEKEHSSKVCQNYHNAIEIIGRRWTGVIIFVLCSGPKRFCEFSEAIPELSARLLTERLKELEENDLIKRQVSQERPIQVVYTLTEKGKALQPVLESLAKWAHTWNFNPDPNKLLK